MNRFVRIASLAATSFAAASLIAAAASAQDKPRIKYPETKKGEQVDDYHGTKVADPYRWLEDLDSADTAAWVAAQNEVSFGYLASIPQREAIKKRLTKLWDYERFGLPSKEGPRYVYSRNSGLQNQSVIYVADTLDAEPRVLIDPNTLAADGTIALGGTEFTEDGQLMAYSISASGSDWREIKVRDVATAKDLDDHLKWVKFSGTSWKKDGSGFFYSRYDEPKSDGNKLEDVNYFQKLFFHKIGTPQSEDKLVYKRDDHKDWGFGGSVTEDGQYLLIYISQGTERKNRLYYQDLTKPDAKVVEMLDEFDAQYNVIGNDGPLFYVFTDNNAPRGRVVAIDSTDPSPSKWKEIIPQTAETLQGVSLLNNNMLVASYLKDATTQVRIFDTAGKHIRDVKLPGLGTAGGFGGRRHETETFYSYTSFNYPPTIFRYDLKTGESKLYKQPKVDFTPENYEVKQVFYKSKDGTQVPMFIAHKKGLKLDGTNPTYLYGYGGFNISLTPSFSISNLVWMEMGGVYAQANLRGGGEYGKDWHNAGRLANKQNVFDDFIAAGEWLIANKYTTNKKLAIGGGSNGGLLVGACMTQRPDLFGACLPAVGVMDMLRFQKFTIGWAWTSDYGSSDDKDQFATLIKYSPLHNLKPGTKYPPTMITTADHDDRVVPSHSFKFAAALQAAHAGDAPVIIRIETKAGHGAGKPTTKIIEEVADRWAFLVRTLGMEPNLN
ncbi:MAG: S9 family peptidase [Phycisphaerales bacterium]|nr:S9 family peptidase [Phycisphaerales bacterium]